MKAFANSVRIVVAVGFYMLWSLQHLYIAVTGHPQLYESFFAASYIPLYFDAWRTVGLPLFPWISLIVVVFEYALAVMMLGRDQVARLGQWAGVLWKLLLAPTPWGYANLILAGVHLWLATRWFGHSALPWARRSRHTARGSGAHG